MGKSKLWVPQIVCPSLFLILLISFLNFHFHFLSFSPIFPATPPHEKQKQGGAAVERIEEELGRARAAILQAGRGRTRTRTRTRTKSSSYTINSYHNSEEGKEETFFIPRGSRSSIYRNPYAFHQSYLEMEKRFKIWVYREGDVPLFHMAPTKSIYSTEGHVMEELHRSPMAASHPDEANAFFLPVSIANIVHYLYSPDGDYHRGRLQSVVEDYVSVLANKYPYWNRSQGADHFMVSCHDWGPYATHAKPLVFINLIRVLCNANVSEGFDPARDVTLPEIKVIPPDLNPPDPDVVENKSVLAFFAGGAHGAIRESLLRQWKDRDGDIQVHEYLPKKVDYFEVMSRAKYCLCPSGYEVASPRVVESMHVGCVPVLISEGYPPPFSDVLDWKSFSIEVGPGRIGEIKEILEGISEEEYQEKLKGVVEVKRHFIINQPPRRYDVLNMVFHSVWLRRLNVRLIPFMLN